MRPEKLSLLDILEAAKAINRFCGTIREDEFLQDELRDTPQPLKRRGFLGQP